MQPAVIGGNGEREFETLGRIEADFERRVPLEEERDRNTCRSLIAAAIQKLPQGAAESGAGDGRIVDPPLPFVEQDLAFVDRAAGIRGSERDSRHAKRLAGNGVAFDAGVGDGGKQATNEGGQRNEASARHGATPFQGMYGLAIPDGVGSLWRLKLFQ